MPTSVAISATCTINGRKVVLNAGDVSKLTSGGLVFSLTQPVRLGTPDEFATWFGQTFGTPFPIPDPASLPEVLRKPFESFKSGTVVLDTLTIDQTTKFYEFGVSFQLAETFSILGGLGLDGIGLLVTTSVAALAVDIKDSDTSLRIASQDLSAFTAANLVKVDNEIMAVKSAADGTLTITQRGARNTAPAQHKQGAFISVLDTPAA